MENCTISGCNQFIFKRCGAKDADNYVAEILPIWGEAVGVLHRLTATEGSLVAEIGPVFVLLPPDLEETLRPHIGAKIGILRIDDPLRPYRFRQISR